MFHPTIVLLLLIGHGLVATALLGTISHQAVACAAGKRPTGAGFARAYSAVSAPLFSRAVAVLFVLSVLLGAVLYPAYRLNVRIPLEEMQMGWAIGTFEMKEHFGGIGLGTLPLYLWCWRPQATDAGVATRAPVTLLLATIVWFDFLSGHVINNIRGL